MRPNVHPIRRALARVLFAVALLAPCIALADSPADHLVITEVSYDVVALTESSEFFEIFNPTDTDVVLADASGAGYFVSDDNLVYYRVVDGSVTHAQNSDWTLRFPTGAVLPARSMLVVTADAQGFADEFFGGDLQRFFELPGSPQLFEFQANGDAVPDMVNVGNSVSMSMTNGGEAVILYRWDGSSDLVADVDTVTWFDTAELINKTGIMVDGPDVDTLASSYAADAATAVAGLDAAQGESLHRGDAIEVAETRPAGPDNGLTGHDESTEDFAASFTIGLPTPGRIVPVLDGDLADLAMLRGPWAVSTQADGPGPLPADYGANGSLAELYASAVDTDGDGDADTLFVGVRGAFFGSNATENGTYLLIDTSPGSGAGVTRFVSAGDALSDVTGALDGQITVLEAALDPGLVTSGIAFDAVAGITEFSATPCGNTDTCGVRGLGTDGVAGLPGDLAWLDGELVLGTVDPALPAAPGAGWVAGEGLELAIPLASLGNPAYVALAVVTAPDGTGVGASPNTLPENTALTAANPQLIEAVAIVPARLRTCAVDTDCRACQVCGSGGFCISGHEGQPCDDASACTSSTVCTQGSCAGGSAVDCSASSDACNEASCDPASGACTVLAPTNEGGACDDGDPCTSGELCAAGVCAGAATDCSAFDDTCNAASCDAATGACTVLTPANEGAACDDGDLCTSGEVCGAGSCAGGGAVDCSGAGDACNAASCDPASGACSVLTPTNEDGACDDGNPCTEDDRCSAGSCAGTPVDVATACGDACNAGMCDPVTGACVTTPAADGTPCDDENACTADDACASGACVGSAADDGTACDDGSSCTLDDACAEGACVGAPLDCSALDRICVVGACNPVTGMCESEQASDGAACDDGNDCTESDVCLAGVCSALEAPDGTACEDGDPCTGGDQCVAGACTTGTQDACAEPEADDLAPDAGDMVLDGDNGGGDDDCGCRGVRAAGDAPASPAAPLLLVLAGLTALVWRRRNAHR